MTRSPWRTVPPTPGLCGGLEPCLHPLGYGDDVTTMTGVTTEEFLAGDWGPGAELVDGGVSVTDPTLWHQEIVRRLVAALSAWVQGASDRGMVGFGGNWVIGPGQVLKPDGWWVADPGRLDLHAVSNDEAPDLVIEVRSPGTWHLDLGPKRASYEAAGAAELWLVDTPAKTVLVDRRSGRGVVRFDVTAEFGPGTSLSSPLLPDFGLGIDELFA